MTNRPSGEAPSARGRPAWLAARVLGPVWLGGCLVSVAFVGGGAAAASCAAPPPLAEGVREAEVVFVGRVVEATDDRRVAAVDVEAVWKGPDLPPRVTVWGTTAGTAGATSVDRHFLAGQRYLFVPTNGRPPFRDNACSLTTPYTRQVDRLSPPNYRPPKDEPGPSRWPLFAALSAGMAIVVGAGWMVGRRRPAPPEH